MKLTPYTIALHVYAQDDKEAEALEQDLLRFVKDKYDQRIYPRAAAISNLIKRHGNNPIINQFIQ